MIMMLTSVGQSRRRRRAAASWASPRTSPSRQQSELLDADRCRALASSVGPHAPAGARRRATRSARCAGRLHVLLAEDNAVNQTLARALLEKRGHTVRDRRQRPRGARTRCEHETFDLVLMDVQMPEMDGFEATAAIRERERARPARTCRSSR